MDKANAFPVSTKAMDLIRLEGATLRTMMVPIVKDLINSGASRA
ncbi:hypothetical protein M728_005389 (plasmid) [Ensifer sp. WSM1721]|nr:hypothetical protein [Ensifer sp. WSM1721]